MARILLIILSVLLFFTITIVQVSQGNPTYNNGRSIENNRADIQRRTINECGESNTERQLCQRCAKLTKSLMAYTKCCENLDNAREWCQKFVNFGLTSINVNSYNT